MENNHQNPDFEERDATLDPDPVTTLNDDELQDSILEDSDMNSFQKAIAKMDEARWTLVQRIGGVLLGIATSVSLFWDSISGAEERSTFSVSLILAVVFALVVPNIIERKGLRRIPKLRVVMVVTLGVMLVLFFVVNGLRNGFSLRS